MDIRNQYAFSQNNFIGHTFSRSHTPLVVASAADGQPVVKPCLADSFIPESDHVALASRPNAETPWQPVRSLAELKEFVANTPADQLGNNLGVWTDKRRFWVVGSRDGQPQNREVQTFGDRWKNMETVVTRGLVDRAFRPENDPAAQPVEALVGLEAARVSVDPKSFTLSDSQFPGKEVGFFHEVGKFSEHDVYVATSMAPYQFESIKNTTSERQEDLIQPGRFGGGTPVYVMPKALGGQDAASQPNNFA